MIYEIVFNNGKVLECWTEEKGHDEILRMMFQDSLFVVRENRHPKMSSYIMSEKVSHFRFPLSNKQTVKPL